MRDFLREVLPRLSDREFNVVVLFQESLSLFMSSPWTPSRPDAALRAAHCDCWNVSRVDLSRSDRIGNDRSNDNTADAGNTVFSPCCTVRASDEHKTNTATKKEKRVQALHGDQEEEINKEL